MNVHFVFATLQDPSISTFIANRLERKSRSYYICHSSTKPYLDSKEEKMLTLLVSSDGQGACLGGRVALLLRQHIGDILTSKGSERVRAGR